MILWSVKAGEGGRRCRIRLPQLSRTKDEFCGFFIVCFSPVVVFSTYILFDFGYCPNNLNLFGTVQLISKNLPLSFEFPVFSCLRWFHSSIHKADKVDRRVNLWLVIINGFKINLIADCRFPFGYKRVLTTEMDIGYSNTFIK